MTAKQILLSPPQLICFSRLCAIIAAFCTFHNQPLLSLCLILSAESLDMLDGYVARKLNKSSAFGTIADMIIDRLTPIFCFTALISLKPHWSSGLSLLLALDLLGHMAMLYSALLIGDQSHHKKLLAHTHPLLNLYYAPKGAKRLFMVLSIAFYDLALISWILYFIFPLHMPMLLLSFFTLLGSMKVYIHMLHLYYSFKLSLPIKN